MDKRCLVEACKREAETHCYHCSRDVCTTHYLEHKKSIQEQLPSFVDEVNVIYERLRRSDKNQAATPAPYYLINVYNQLDQWRLDCHQHIDTVYQGVRNQIENIAESRKNQETQKAVGILESLEKMREQLKELLNEGDVTYRQLETMKKQLEEIKKKEQESINYPDIRIITKKIDVEKHARVTVESKRPIDEQRISTSPWLTPPET
jgi:DNA repair exonuclease SbcCD ATPase subunit